METNANYQELKETTKTFLQMVTSNDLYYALFLFIFLIVALKLTDLIFAPFKKRKSLVTGLIKGCIKAFLLATVGMRICSLVPILQDFTSQILLSSSLIVVVLGFVFQEGLSNIVHGFIISVFRPFKIGDRIVVKIDGESVTGYVREITTRHTVLQNVANSSHMIVPNSKMDMSLIENSYYDPDAQSSAFLDMTITYESDLEKAITTVRRAIERHPLVEKARLEKKITEPAAVMVRELGESGICLRGIVVTATIEENFQACSDLRRDIVHLFSKDPDITFAYPHIQISPSQRRAAGQ